MNIGVIGDTHRNIDYMRRVVDWMVQKRRVTGLYHLGDDYDDTLQLAEYHLDIVQVPGLYDPRYLDKSLPAVVRENVLGLQILVMHSIEKDLVDDDRQSSDIILHGHTHHPQLRLEDGHLFMNPGHLKGEKDKNTSPAFGLLEISDKAVNATLLDLKFGTLQAMKLRRADGGLYKS